MRSAALLAVASLLAAGVAVPAADEPALGGGMVVSVTVPVGSLSLTADVPMVDDAGCTATVTVTDTRAGDLGFTVTIVAPRRVALVAQQVPGNAMRPDDVRVIRSGGTTTATYPAGTGLGSVRLVATSSDGCPSVTLV